VPDAKKYAFLHQAEHFAAAGRTEALFHALEQTPFLADQAAHLGSFRQGAEDLLSFALPGAIRCEDWNRFLRLALRALNLRRMSRSLASPEILHALVSSGWVQLALDVAAEQPEPAGRIRARAAVASRIEEAERRRSLLASLDEDLQDLPAPWDQESAVARAEIFRSIAREITPRDWPGGERMLAPLAGSPDLIDGIWIAAAEGCLNRSGLADDELWNALRRVQNPEHLRALLPFPLADAPGQLDPQRLRERLPGLPPGLFWPTCFALVGRLARESLQEALCSWEAISQEASIPWSAEWIDLGKDLFRKMGAERIRLLAACIADPTSQAALWTLCLESEGDRDTARQAFEAIRRLPAGPKQVHWSLRYLRADRVSPIDQIRRHTEAARLFFLEHHYSAPPRDLALYLDQIAEILPERCAGELQNVAGHLGSLDVLEELAAALTVPALLADVHERAEVLTILAAPGSKDQRFETASRLLISLASRLCAVRGDLFYLRTTAHRLPPGRKDALRAAVARGLFGAGRLQQAEEVASGIGSSDLRLATLLDLWPLRAENLLREPPALYAAFAQAGALRDEWLGLAALLAPQANPEEAGRWLCQMRPGPTAAAAVFRVARHSLEFQETAGGTQRDGLAVLHFVERALQDGALPRSPGWLPAVVELGARAENHRLGQELPAACTELFARPWAEEGREIFEDLLVRLRCSLPPAGLYLALRVLLDALLDLPDDVRQTRLVDMLPLLCVAAQELPERLAWLIATPLRRAAGRAMREESEVASAAWIVAHLCLATRSELREAAAFLLEQEKVAPIAFHTIALLLGPADPAQAVSLVLRTPSDSERDAACLRLLRHSRLPAPQSRELLAAIQEPAIVRRAALGLEEDDASWLTILTEPGENSWLDPSAPASGPHLERLWEIDPRQSRPILAEAAVAAFQAGPDFGEQALRLWLHAHLPPSPKGVSPERRNQSAEIEASLTAALTLSASDAAAPASSLIDPAPEAADIEEMATGYLRWKQASSKALLRFLSTHKTWIALHWFVAITALFLVADFELDFPDIKTDGDHPLFWLLVLYPLDWLLHVLDWTHMSQAWLALPAVYPINAFLIHALLDGDTPHQDLRTWVKGLRFALGGLPLVGLAVIPAWQTLSSTRPSWAFRRSRPSLLLETEEPIKSFAPCFRWARGWMQRVPDAPRFLFLWLWAVNLIVVRLGTSRLSADDLLRPEGRVAVSILLHLIGFAATASWLLFGPPRNALPRYRTAAWISASTWLLPFPFPLLSLPAFAASQFGRLQTAGALAAATEDPAPSPEWTLLLERLRRHARQLSWRRRPWGLELPPRAGLGQQRFLALCRWKTFLLLFDGLLFTLLAGLLTRHTGLPIALAISVFLVVITIFLLMAGLAGLAIRRISLLRRLVRTGQFEDDDDPHPFGRSLTVTSGALIAGITLGVGIVAGNHFLFAFALFTLGLIGTVLMVPPEHKIGNVGPSLGQFSRRLLVRFCPLLLFFLLGLFALGGKGQSSALISLFISASLLSPAFALATGLLGHARLLRPFKVRHLFSSLLPFRARLVLAALLLTLAIPLGGLAIPIWIWTRQHLWPAWERELSAAGDTP
jgi:hypothetical protein